jgi:putative acetyltransferase
MPLLRTATANDTAGILKLIAEVYAEYGLVLDTDNDEPHLLHVTDFFRSRDGDFWVVDDDNLTRATVGVFLTEAAAELKTLYVHPSLRRQGWGRRLVELVMDYSRHAGKRKIQLWSDTRFINAHRLYKQMGFTECGMRQIHDSNMSEEYGFEKQLTE